MMIAAALVLKVIEMMVTVEIVTEMKIVGMLMMTMTLMRTL